LRNKVETKKYKFFHVDINGLPSDDGDNKFAAYKPPIWISVLIVKREPSNKLKLM